MTRERHVRFCERLAVKFRRPTYQRQAMIDGGGELSVKRQAELLDLSRASVYYRPRPVSARDLQLMRRIDELHLEAPFYGARKIAAQLQREGHKVGRRHVRSLMRQMGIEYCLCGPGQRLVAPVGGHRKNRGCMGYVAANIVTGNCFFGFP